MAVSSIFLVFAMVANCGAVVPSVEVVVDSAVNPVIAKGNFVGLVVGVVEEGYSNLYFYGTPVDGSTQPVTATTLFRIGSNTKPFAATALAALAADGTLNVTDTLESDLPGRHSFPPGTWKQQITLEMLATHTAGWRKNPKPLPSTSTYTAEQLVDLVTSDNYKLRASSTTGVPEPYFYSNVGYALLGIAEATKTHTKWFKLVHQTITKPLDMPDTVVYQELTSSQKKRLATGYEVSGTGKATAIPPEQILTTFPGPASNPAGGLFSTGSDMMKWLQFNVGNSTNTQLSPLLPTMQKVIVTQTYTSSPTVNLTLGWFENTVLSGEYSFPMYSKNGATDGFVSWVGYVPGLRVGVFLLANTSNGAFYDAGKQIVNQLIAEPIRKAPPEGPGKPPGNPHY